MSRQRARLANQAGIAPSFVRWGIVAALIVVVAVGLLMRTRMDAQDRQLVELITAHKQRVGRAIQGGRFAADIGLSTVRQFFDAPYEQTRQGEAKVYQLADHYVVRYAAQGRPRPDGTAMDGEIVGTGKATQDAELPRLQGLLGHLHRQMGTLFEQPWAARVTQTYWISADRSHLVAVPARRLDAALTSAGGDELSSDKGVDARIRDADKATVTSRLPQGVHYWTDAWVDLIDGDAYQSRVQSVYDKDNTWVGNVVVVLNVGQIDHMLQDESPPDIQWLLVTLRGTVLAKDLAGDKELDGLDWGATIASAGVHLPPPQDGIREFTGPYVVRVAEVPGNKLYLYQIAPKKRLYAGLVPLAGGGAAALLLTLLAMAMLSRYMRQRDALAAREVLDAQALAQAETEQRERGLEYKAWASKLGKALQDCDEQAAFGAALLAELVPKLGGAVGAVFSRGADNRFLPVAAHGLPVSQCIGFADGEGIAGAAAAQGDVVRCTQLPEGYLSVDTGMAVMPVRELLVVPIHVRERVGCVIEIGFIEQPADLTALLDEVIPVVTFNLELVQRAGDRLHDLRARAALEERQRRVLASVQDGIVGVTPNGRISFANEAAVTLLDYVGADLTGRDVNDLLRVSGPDGAPNATLAETIGQTLADGESRAVEAATFMTRNGVPLTVEFAVSALAQDDGAHGAVVSFRDIGERRRAANEVADQLALQHALFDTIPYPIFYKDAQARFLGFNKAYETIFNMRREDRIGKTALELDYLPEANRQAFHDEDVRLIAAGGLVKKEVPIKFADGKLHQTLYYVAAFRKTDGSPGGLIGTFIDVSDRKKAEDLEALVAARTEALAKAVADVRENEARLRDILEHSPSAVTIVDDDGKQLYTNRRLSEMFGLSREEMMRRRSSEFWVDAAKRDDFIAQLRRDGSVADLEVHYRRDDGSTFWALLNSSYVILNGNRYLLSWFFDISQRKEAEAELLRAQRLAEEAAQTKSDFLANMSHEIRTPMNAIIGMSHLALAGELPPKQRQQVEKVHQSATTLLGIVNAVLDFSRLDAGTLEIADAPFDLATVFDQLVAEFAVRAEQKSLELVVDCPTDVPTALIGDGTRVRQILAGLVDNAVKFTEQGEVVIGVRKESTSGDQAVLHFSVSDTGIGLAPAQEQRLFEAFSQGDGSATRKYGGIGLGLAIIKRLAEAMSGSVWADSAAGSGATFHVRIQVGVAAAGETPAINSLAGERPVRALVVDDNAAARAVTAALLTSFGAQVTSAPSGANALADIAVANRGGEGYDLVIVDWRMPVMDGLTLIKAMQRAELAAMPRTILLVPPGTDNALGVEVAQSVAVSEFVVKPVRAATLAAAVDRVLRAAAPALVAGAELAADALPGHGDNLAAPEGAAGDINELLDRLEALLHDSDTEAADVLDQLVAADRSGDLVYRLRPVRRAIEAFDYDAALVALGDVRSGLGN